MPRFYLNLRTREDFVEDPDGLDLPSVEAAKQEAIRGARSILADDVMHGRIDLTAQIEVTDETGTTIAVIRFEDVLEIER